MYRLILLLCFAFETLSAPFKVGVLENAQPFSFFESKKAQGFAVQLWETLAKENHWDYTYTPAGQNYDAALATLQKGGYDVLLGPFQPQALNNVMFSQGYFLNTSSLIILKDDTHFLEEILVRLPVLLGNSLIILIVCWLLFPLLILWIEPEDPHLRPYGKGYRQVLWGFFLLLRGTDVLYNPKRIPAIFVYLVWILISFYMLAALSGIITEIYVLGSLYNDFDSPEDLKNNTFAISKTWMSAEHIKDLEDEYKIRIIPCNTVEEGLDTILAGKTEGLITGVAFRNRHLQTDQVYKALKPSHLELSSYIYSFALHQSFPHLTTLNKALQQPTMEQKRLSLCTGAVGQRNMLWCQL